MCKAANELHLQYIAEGRCPWIYWSNVGLSRITSHISEDFGTRLYRILTSFLLLCPRRRGALSDAAICPSVPPGLRMVFCGRDTPSKVPFSVGDLELFLVHGTLGTAESTSQSNLDRFIRLRLYPTDHATCVAIGRSFTLSVHAMCPSKHWMERCMLSTL